MTTKKTEYRCGLLTAYGNLEFRASTKGHSQKHPPLALLANSSCPDKYCLFVSVAHIEHATHFLSPHIRIPV